MVTMFCIFSLIMLWISFKAFVFFIAIVAFLCFRKHLTAPIKEKPSTNNQEEIKTFLAMNKTLFYVSTPVAGTISKIVVKAGDDLKNGDVMLYMIDDDGQEDNVTVTVDAHVYRLLVQEGQNVTEGQNLAIMDNYKLYG